ncbi:MAG: DUF4097 family beta strand repeat protein [Acidobacteria bacterium]|nr:DUF4097 family beta strand repeat protein [Acidobacteriota bacterium]
MTRWPIASLLLPALLVLTACDIEDFGSVNQQKEDFQRTLSMKPGGRLSVESFNGSIEIRGGDGDAVEISGTKYAATRELLEALKIDIVSGADSVRIRTVRPSDRRGNLGARYVIRVPRRTELDRIDSSNGSIRVETIEGGARLKTSNGSVRVDRLKGSVEIQTSNGGVELIELSGAATLRTSNGTIRTDGVRGAFDATTSNGRIEARISEPEARKPIKLSTSNGSVSLTVDSLNDNEIRASTSNSSITLRLPPSLNARLMARTSNGSIQNDYDLRGEGVRISKHSAEGQIGSGGPLIDLSTSNGPIRLVRR